LNATARISNEMTDVSSQTLHVVSKELGTTLNEARVALENYAEHPDTTKLLEQCAQQLHQAHGVLRMVEVYGAALLAEEMEQVTRYLAGATSADKNQAEGLDALMRAMVQLPAYLERVLSGGRDLALVLLPLLNDLRAVRGSSLLSEGTLLLLNLKSDQQATPMPGRAGEAPLTVVQWARRLRARFQVGLLGWIRGERVTQNLEILGRVAEKLEQVATTQAVFQLWWAVGAVLEALREQGLSEGATIKRLMGLADREIKRLYVQGEARYGETPPLDLLNNLLYYVARASSRGARVMAVRASFKLGELLPVDDSVEQERESLSAPSVKLMRTVGAAIKEDLSKVKDVLDIFVRKGATQIDELAPQLDLLRKISDTLGVLGLGGLRTRVQNEIQHLQGMLTQGTPTNDSALVQMAATLISVEDSLDDQLVRLILPAAPAQAAAEPESDVETGPDTDYQQVTGAVMRECIVNLARIKDAITLSVQKPAESQGLDQIPQLLRGITAGLLMLGKARAVEIVENIAQLMQDMLQPGVRPPPDRLDRFADAIVSIEYYMETVQSGRSDPWYMLDNAETCLKALQQMHTTVVPAGLPPDSGVHTRTIAVDTAHPAPTATPRVDTTATDPAAERQAASHPVLATSETRKLDPEFLALFIEEAREEVASINRQFQLWDQNPADGEALVSVRRSFHTLKGSGRMVGAMLLGEFSWSVENLLNRIIAKTLIRTPGMMAVLREAVRALPQLVEQLENGRASDFDITSIMARAHAFAEGREADQIATGTIAPEDLGHGVETFADSASRQPLDASTREGPRPTTPAPPAMDPVLHDIYSRESAGHLATLRDYIRKNAAVPPPWKVPEAVYRACHTLSGSSKMADARHGIRIAEPLNHYMRRLFDSGVGLDAAGIDVLRKSVDAIEQVIGHINESSGFFAPHGPLIERIRALDHDLDERFLERGATDGGPPQAQAAPSPTATVAEEIAEAEDNQEFDAEVAAIFSEEATELLESADRALQGWKSERGNKELAFELKRQLHTLKGGARMAGIGAMGTLSHELETLVIQIDDGRIAKDDRAFEVLQASLDELSHMRDAVGAGRRVASARDVIRRIRALANPATAKAPLAPPAPPPAPAPAAAPKPAARLAQAAAPRPTVPPAQAPAPRPAAPPPPAASRSIPNPATPVVPRSSPAPEMSPRATAPSAAASPKPEPPKVTVTSKAELVTRTPPPSSRLPPEEEAETEEEAAPIALPPGREPQPVAERQELARVDADLLDTLLNNAGEVSIFRSRLEQQVSSIDFNLAELSRTVTRLKEQLRKLELETEAQILHRHQDDNARRQDFDPLELDRYSAIQQFTRALAESSSDVGSIQGLLENLTREAHNLLLQQSRVITELQNGLMRTRMVPFQRHVQRLTRLVRQVANETDKKAEFVVEGATGELDRQVLERMLPPFEHMLRNAVVHGLEPPAERVAKGKPETGRIAVSLHREGAEVVIVVRDDGAGMNVRAIREKAVAMGLVDPRQSLTDEEAMQLILEPGFSTAGSVTKAAGRGVGMDVVATEVKKLGGALFIESTPGQGTMFTVRLPFTLAISQSLIVRVVDELYALPLPTVEGIVRLSSQQVAQHLAEETPSFDYGGQKYRFQHLGAFLGSAPALLPEGDASVPVILVRAGEHSTALVADELVGSREIVVKSVGPQISSIRGISGATILGDGRIVIILDVGALVRSEWRSRPLAEAQTRDREDKRVFALVVDDSITVRRVTQRLLERNGMRVMTAKDGMDAVSILQEHLPDVILLDIEMPRMDGYEVASQVRNDPRLKEIPIVMITSRVGEKHRARAIELGVNDYLGKPYQEAQLLDAIEPLVRRRRRHAVN
jgi:chemosensory pili system protein ChpA (sensor histidine kinase/response regulator)